MADRHAELLFKINFALGEEYPLENTPQGTRRSVRVTGGTFTGPKLQGTVRPGGGDWLLIRPDGARELDVRVTLQTDDGHLISMSYRSISTMSQETLQRIQQGESVDPAEYYLRTTPVFETGSEKYGWLNRIIAMDVGRRTPTGVAYTVYAVL
jgi:hypothetical protein